MRRIDFAYLDLRGIRAAVFDADASSSQNNHRDQALAELRQRVRSAGLRVDLAALAYNHCGRIEFYGAPALVEILSRTGHSLPWNHSIAI